MSELAMHELTSSLSPRMHFLNEQEFYLILIRYYMCRHSAKLVGI